VPPAKYGPVQAIHDIVLSGLDVPNDPGDDYPTEYKMNEAEVAAKKRGQNQAGYCNKEFDRLMAEAAKIQDPKRRYELYSRALRIINEDIPDISLALCRAISPIRRKFGALERAEKGASIWSAPASLRLGSHLRGPLKISMVFMGTENHPFAGFLRSALDSSDKRAEEKQTCPSRLTANSSQSFCRQASPSRGTTDTGSDHDRKSSAKIKSGCGSSSSITIGSTCRARIVYRQLPAERSQDGAVKKY
jgi:hypothetical protein